MAPVLVKSLSRLSRSSLIDLALKWLQQSSSCEPYLACNRTVNESDEEDYLFTAAEDVEELRMIYNELREDDKETSKGQIVDRIVDGDWRRGLSLEQIAMVDLAYLEQNDTALRWNALKLAPMDETSNSMDHTNGPPLKKRKVLHHTLREYPSISPPAFVAALKSEISALVKAHYYLHRLPAPYNLPILRLYISPKGAFGPRSTSIPRPPRHAIDTGRIMYIALPESCPYIYVSLSGSSGPSQNPGSVGQQGRAGQIQAKVDMASMKRIILEAIPKAISRPQERWSLEQTKLTARSLRSICGLRGNGKPSSSGGAYSKFVREDGKVNDSPVEVAIGTQRSRQSEKTPQADSSTSNSASRLDSHHQQIDNRFGSVAGPYHAPLDRFHVTLTDTLRSPASARPTIEAAPIGINFGGSDIFAGLKKLAEFGSGFRPDQEAGRLMNMAKVPSWMTGEMGVSSLVV